MSEGKTTKGCACTQKLSDLLRAPQPVKKSSLKKVTCADCGKVSGQIAKQNTASTVRRKGRNRGGRAQFDEE